MRFATYGRKSVYSDKSDSVDNQERMCREYADFRFKGQVESFESYSDEGFTGANTNRPGLKRLLMDIEDGFVDVLIVYQLDRLSRDVRDFSNIYAALEEKHVMFISIKENIDTNTPIGKAMMYVTMVFAQMERETIAARVTDNLKGLARKGFWTGGKAPQGYSLERIEVNGKKHVTLSVKPDEAAHIQWLFDVFLENNYSLWGMQETLKKQGIKTINGAFFPVSRLHKLLSSPYCVEATKEIYDFFANKGCQMDANSPRESWDGTHGVMVYGRSSEKNRKHVLQSPDKWIVCIGYHKPFISAEKWLAAQERFKKNTFDKAMKYDVPLLKGVVRCAKCGCKMAVARKKLKSGILSHYYCRKRNQQGIEACDMGFIKCTVLDNKVLDAFRKIEADPETIRQYLGDEPVQDNGKKIKELESRAGRIRAKIERLAESISDAEESTAAKYIIAQIEKEDLNLSAVSRELEILKAETRRQQGRHQSAEQRIQEIANLVGNLDGLSSSEQNMLAKDIIQECTWDGDTFFLRL